MSANEFAIDFKIEEYSTSTEVGNVELHLTNDNGATLDKGVYNSATRGVVTSAATTADLKRFKVTAAWNESAKPTRSDDIAYLKGKRVTGALLTSAGNVWIRTYNINHETEYQSIEITVDIDDDNVNTLTVSLQHSVDSFRIATNNPYGAEVAAEAATGYQAPISLVSDGSVAIPLGQAYTDGAGKYYVAKVAKTAVENTSLTLAGSTTVFEEVKLHTADDFKIAAVAKAGITIGPRS